MPPPTGSGPNQPRVATQPDESTTMVGPTTPRYAIPSLTVLENIFRDPAVAWSARIAAMDDWMTARGAILRPGEPMSRDEFAAQAQALGLKIELITTPLSRFGNRPPEVIGREGFSPNPNEKPGSILAHLERRSCALVSLTEVGTEHVAEGLALVRNAARRLAPDNISTARELIAEWKTRYEEAGKQVRETDLKNGGPTAIEVFQTALATIERFEAEMLQKLGTAICGAFPQRFSLFEYKIVGAEGVRPNDIAGFPYPKQREVTVREIAPQQIVAYREVTVDSMWTILGDLTIVTAGELPKSHEDAVTGGTSVSFGEWRAMPNRAP